MDPSVRKNKDEVDQLLAPNFFEYGSSGKIWTRVALIDSLSTEEPTQVVASGFKAQPLSDDTVLITYKTKKVKSGTESLRSSIWRNNGGKWQMVFHQGTGVMLENESIKK